MTNEYYVCSGSCMFWLLLFFVLIYVVHPLSFILKTEDKSLVSNLTMNFHL